MLDFWDFIFGGDKKGLVRVAISPRRGKFSDRFVHWPDDKELLLNFTHRQKQGDLYFCPALYKLDAISAEHPASKPNVLGSHVVWIDLDRHGTRPPEQPRAGLSVTSGSEGHRHLYWRSYRFLDPVLLEQWNLELQKDHNADPSGWDCNQLLRVPDTLNHKTDPPLPVALEYVEVSQKISPPTEFKHAVAIVQPADFAANQTKLADIFIKYKHRLTPQIETLLQQNRAEDRSRDLYSLSCLLFEQDMEIAEVYALLTYADERWGKFHSRDDKEARLQDIISRTVDRRRNVSFDLGRNLEERQLQPIGWTSLSTSERKVSWVVEGILREKGFMLVTGDAGVGKSTLLLNMGAGLVLQRDSFAGFAIPKNPQRILFGSHEMDEAGLNYFLGNMGSILNTRQLDILENGFEFVPAGESIYLDTREGQEFYEKALRNGDYTGLIVDTLGASVSATLSDEAIARNLCDWVSHIRQEFGIWVTLIHHPRKATPGGRTGDRLDDTYGSRIFFDRADSVLFLRKGKNSTVELHSRKIRFGPNETYRVLRRSDQLWFDHISTVNNDQPSPERDRTSDMSLDTPDLPILPNDDTD